MGLFESLDGLLRGDVGGDDDIRGDFFDYAEELADSWPDANLDFSPESLGRLDDFVDDQWDADRFRNADFGGDDPDSKVFTGTVVQLGAYFGEVLVRSLDAEWVDDEDFDAAVRAFGEEEDAVVNVFHVAAESLREPSKFATTFERVEGED